MSLMVKMSLKNAKNKVSDLNKMPLNSNAVRKKEIGKRKKKITLSMCLPLPEDLVTKNKTKKEVDSAKKSPCKNLRNHLALHSDTFNSSPSSSEASQYIAISEAESCPSERVSPHTDDTLRNFIPSPNHNPSKVLPPKESENVTSYGSACSPIHTLSNIEFICDSNINPSIESTRADCVLESLENNRLSPKNSFLLLINKLNLTKDSSEDFICNQLKCEPLIKPDGFNYENNQAFSIAVDVTMLKAASDYIKENLSKQESFPITLPNGMKDYWQDNLVKSSDLLHLPEKYLDLNESDCNQFYTEDAESEISICSSTEIRPEFFDALTNLDAISLEKCDIFSSDYSFSVAANEVCGTANESNQDVLPGIEEHSVKTLSGFSNTSSEKDILNDIIQEGSMPTANKAKRKKRKRSVWSTRKRRNCRKKQSKPDSIIQDLCCDTCDESEIEIDEPTSDYISSKCLSNVDESNELQKNNNIEDIEVSNSQESMQNNKNSSAQICKKNEVNIPISPDCNTCDEEDNNEDICMSNSQESKQNKKKSTCRKNKKNDKNKQNNNSSVQKCKKNEVNKPIFPDTLYDEGDSTEDISMSNSQESKKSNTDKLVSSNNLIVESSKNNKHGGKDLKLLQANCQPSIVNDKNINSSVPAIKRKRNQVRNSSENDISATLKSSTSENSVDLKPEDEFGNTKPKRRKVDKNKNSKDNIMCSIPFKTVSTDSNISNEHSDNDIVYNTETKPKIKNKGMKSNSHKENSKSSPIKLKNVEAPTSEMHVIEDKLSDNSSKKDPKNSSISLENYTKSPTSDMGVISDQVNTKTLYVKLDRLNELDKFQEENSRKDNFCKEMFNNIDGIDSGIEVNSNRHELKKDSLTSPVKNGIQDENYESLSTQASLLKSKSPKKLKVTSKKNKFSEKEGCENLPIDKNSGMHLRKGMSILPHEESNTVKSKSLSPSKVLERENFSESEDSENENNAQSVYQKEREIPSNVGLPVSESSQPLLSKSKGTNKVSKVKRQNSTKKNVKSDKNIHEVTSIVMEPCAKIASEDSLPNSSSSKSDSNKKLKATAKKNKLSEKEGCENLPVVKNSEMHLRKDVPILPQDKSKSLSPPKVLEQENISALKDSENKNNAQSVFQRDREIPSNIGLPVSESSQPSLSKSKGTDKVSKVRKQHATKKNVKSDENIHEVTSLVIEPRAKSVSEDSSSSSKKLKATTKKNKYSEKEGCENLPIDKNSEMPLRKRVPTSPQDESNTVKSKSLSPPKLLERKNISASEDFEKKTNAQSLFQEEREVPCNTSLPVSESSHASLFKSKVTDKVSKTRKQDTNKKMKVKSGESIHSVTSIAIQPHTKSTSENSTSPNSPSSKIDSNKITKSSKKLKLTAKKNKLSEKVVHENPPVDKNSETHLRKDVSILSQDESNTVKSKSLSPPKLLEKKNISISEDSKNKNNGQSVFQEREIPSNIDLPVPETSTEIFESSSSSIITSPSEPRIKKMNKSTVAFENQNVEAVVIRIKNNVCSLVSETDEQLSKNSKTVPVKIKNNKKASKVKMLSEEQKEPLFVDNCSSLSTKNSNISPQNFDNSSTGNALSKSEENYIAAEINLHLEEFDNSEFFKNPLENDSLLKSHEEVVPSEITDTFKLKNNNDVLNIVNETQQTLILPIKQLENTVPTISNYQHEVSNHKENLIAKSSANKPKNLKAKSSSREEEKTDEINGKETFLSDITEQSNLTKVEGGNHLKNVVDFGNSLNQINTADNIHVEESLTKLSSQNETEVPSSKYTELHDISAQILPMNDNYSLTDDEDLDFEYQVQSPEIDQLDESKGTNFEDNSADINKSSVQSPSSINSDSPVFTFHAEADKLVSDEESESDEGDNFKRSRNHRNTSSDESYYSSKSNHETYFIQNEALSSESTIQKSVEIMSNLDESNKLISEVQNTFHSDKASKSSSTKISRLDDVRMKIKEYCNQKQYNEAVGFAKTYITISSSNSVHKFILQKLLTNLLYSICNPNTVHLSNNKILDNILELMQNKQNDDCLCDKQAASYFISKCCVHPDLEIYAVKLYDFCHIKHIPLSTKALCAFNSLLKTEDVSLRVLLHYFQYVKSVCFKTVSKDLTHIALEKSKKSKFSDVHSMCEFLYCITLKEVEKQDLKGFLELCFKKGMWAYIAEMFIKWKAKESLMTCIYDALFSDFEKMGNYFFKFAGAVYAQGDDISPALSNFFGQIGTTLMLNAVLMNRTKTALEILHVLHTYNVNYSEVQLLLMEPPSKVNDSINIIPYSIIFNAIDICLDSKRPKDAFIIFQGFSWIRPNENFNEAEKAYLLNEKCERLLKLIPLLNREDSLNEGWEALKVFLSEAEQDSYREKLNENKKEACLIYNKYLVHLLNSGKISSVQDLYQYSLGPKKDIFLVSPKLLRGLVITFSSHGMTEEASSVFTLGVLRKVYSIEKPETGSFPWDIVIMSDWTTVEIKLAVEWFVKTLIPLLADKPKETNFEKWFSVRISFKVSDPIKSKILCLKDTQSDSESCVQRAKNALQNMDPSLQFTEEPNKNTLCITSDSLYHYWKSKYSDVSLKFPSSDTNILSYHKRLISFGNEISIPIEDPYFATPISEKSNKLENRQMKSPRDNISTSAETFVSDMIDEIRANQHSDQYMPSSPKCSPPKSYQKLLNNDKSSSSVLMEDNTSSSVGGMEVAVPSKQAFRTAIHTNTSNITKTFINDTFSNTSSGNSHSYSDNQMISKTVSNHKSLRLSDTYSNISSGVSPNFSDSQMRNKKVSNSKSPRQNCTHSNVSSEHSPNFSSNQIINTKVSISQKQNDSNNQLTNSKLSNSNSPKKNDISNNKSLKPSANLSNNQPINSKLSSTPKLTVKPQRINKDLDVSNIQNMNVAQNVSDETLIEGTKLLKQTLGNTNLKYNKVLNNGLQKLTKQSSSTPQRISFKSNSVSKKKPPVSKKKTDKNLQKGDYKNFTIFFSSKTSIRTVSDTSKTNSLLANQKDTSNVEENVTPEFVVKLPGSDIKIPAVPSASPKKTIPVQSNSSGLPVNLGKSQIFDQEQKVVTVSDKTSPFTNLPKLLADVVPGKTSISASPKQSTGVVEKPIIRLKIVRDNQVSDATKSGNTPVCKTILQTNASTPRTFNKPEISKNSTLNANVDFIHDKEKLKAVRPVSTAVSSSSCSRVRNTQGTGRKRRPSIILAPSNTVGNEATKRPTGIVRNRDIGNGFKRIIAYLKVRIAQKYKNLSSDEQDQKAHELALMFTNNNTKIEVLDKGSMTCLFHFANRNA